MRWVVSKAGQKPFFFSIQLKLVMFCHHKRKSLVTDMEVLHMNNLGMDYE